MSKTVKDVLGRIDKYKDLTNKRTKKHKSNEPKWDSKDESTDAVTDRKMIRND